MQVGSLAEPLYTLLRKKVQTLKQISHCRPASLAKLVCLPCFNLPLGQKKRVCLPKKTLSFWRPDTWRTAPRVLMASFPPGVAEQHRRLAARCALPAPSGPMSRSRSAVAVPAALWLSPRRGGCPRGAVAVPAVRWRSGRGPSAVGPRPCRREGAEPGAPGSSRCPHCTAAPARPPPARRAEGRASASLSATFVFLISFYFKVYQLLYYQAELSLQSLPLSSSFPFFLFLETINVSGPSCHRWFFITV